MIANLERTPPRYRVDVEAACNELSPGSPGSWVLPFGAILRKDCYKVLRVASVEAALIMVELQIVSQHAAKTRQVALAREEQVEQLGFSLTDNFFQFRLRRQCCDWGWRRARRCNRHQQSG
jgi:hypothetical protein